jgi:hypothetical protein
LQYKAGDPQIAREVKEEAHRPYDKEKQDAPHLVFYLAVS